MAEIEQREGFHDDTLFGDEYDHYGDEGKIIKNHFAKTEAGFILRNAIKEYALKKVGGKCIFCGTDFIPVLALHHGKKNKKTFSLSRFVTRNVKEYSIAALDRELEEANCGCACITCHMEHHFPKDSISKGDLLRRVGIYHCMLCGYSPTSTSALDFHHKEGCAKLFEISSSYSSRSKFPLYNRELCLILNEIKKTNILCSNCHSIQHTHLSRFIRLKDKIYEKSIDWEKRQREMALTGQKKVNIYADKKNKRFERGYRPAPEDNGIYDLDGRDSITKTNDEYNERLGTL